MIKTEFGFPKKIIEDVAREYIALKEKKVEIDVEMKKLEKEYLIPYAETICILDLEKKVTYIAEKMTTQINAEKLFDQLWSEMRGQEIKSYFSITEKALLNEFDDGEDLIKKYKENKSLSKASFRVSKMTKAEIKLEEGNV